jgi:drug/metabolite transporter (DMT)-like permease
MTPLTHDIAAPRIGSGLAFAAVAAVAFGLSGSLAKGLLENGWTAGSAVLARVTIAAIVLAIPGALALRGRWHLLRRSIGPVVMYGLFAVAGAQLFYFLAVGTLDVGVALLIEYLAPVAVVLWLWVRKGQRPGKVTALGAVIAAVGLALLLNVVGGGNVSLVGVGWALLAMVGATVYFIISGDASNPLPPISLAAGGLAVAAVVLALAAAVGILPLATGAGAVEFVSFSVPAWLAVVLLGVVTAAVAYVAGIAATRRLGSRLGSFVALSEVIAAATLAWLLLGQTPLPIQIAGAALVLVGVIVVKLGEPKHVLGPVPLTEEETVEAPPTPVAA